MKAIKVILHGLAFCLAANISSFAQFRPSLLAVIEGEKDGDWFGHSLAGGGDINGDGYDDIGISGGGKIHIYLGSSSFDKVVDLIITRESGFSRVAMGGDVNGDGYDDILTAKPLTPILTKAYLYLGGSKPDSIPDFTFESPYWSFGFSVSISGDYNKDGYDDLLVSSNDQGRVYLYLGSAPMDTVADAVFYEGGGLFGSHLSSAGDINGDGYDDVLIDGHNLMTSFIYLGADLVDQRNDIVFPSQGGVTAADFNGDGYSDVMISGDGSENGIFYGSAVIDSTVDVKISAYEVASGHFNRDHYADLLVGKGSDYGGLGAVWVYLGGNPMDNRFDWGGRGTGGGNLGTAVANAGDVNGDGVEDILVSEPNYFYGKMKGRVFVIAGDTSTVTAVGSDTEFITKNFILYPNYPNPFNQSTTINYQIPDGIWPVCLKIFNPLGEEVKTIVERTQRGGNYQAIWNATDRFGKEVSSGVYLLVLQVGDFQRVRKVLLIR